MKSQKQRILELLKQKPVRNVDFYRMDPPILRGGARIHDLRRDGYDISIKKVGKGVWEYTLIQDEEDNVVGDLFKIAYDEPEEGQPEQLEII